YAQGAMAIQIKSRQRIYRLLLLIAFTSALTGVSYLVIDYIKMPSTSIEIRTKSYECKNLQCTYKVEIKNKSKEGDKGYLRVNGVLMMSNAIKSSVTHQFHTEKIKIELDGLQQKQITGSISIKDNNSYLKFKILPI
ncbi:hypothetical protein, partial [Thalassotalea sp. SU-HH00458]|uniref:hypothetical protein n=1 Tax=Thalassotalea sp. SU-HH00458 TaxID=3127657 RepID=UPI003365ADEA